MKNKILVLTLVTALLFAMSSCVFIDKEHEHQFGEEWVSDDSYHWHVCAGDECDEIADKAEHTGGTATETEKAKCDVCGAEYGELLAHTHVFGEWETKTPANCDDAEVEIRYCACGASETRTGDAALGHSYTEQVVSEDYLATANCGEQASYYYSCSCGAKGEETFFTGDVIEHVFGEWQTKTPANCTDAEVEIRYCACGVSETQTGDAALDHNMVAMSDDTYHWTECDREGCNEATEKVAHEPTALSVVANLTSPMQYDVVKLSDLAVTASCDCGANISVTDGVIFNELTLAEGANTISVSFAGLTATTTVEAAKFNVALSGAITDDTYVYSNGKDADNTAKVDMGTYSSQFRVYFKADFAKILENSTFTNNTDKAKVQFKFVVTSGSITADTTFTLKAYAPAAGVTDVAFSSITWNNVDTSKGSYSGLHWSNGSEIVFDAQGHNVSFADGIITVTVAYSEIAEFVDEANGTLVFAFATNTSGVKIASIENSVEAKHPSVSVIINDDHFHVFNQKKAEADYLVSANCTEKAKYLYSCSCGEAGTKTFEHGDVIEHQFGEWQTRSAATCTEAEVEYRVCACGAEETQTGDAALEHNMETKFDETNHWTECSRCDEATAPVAHFGGEATETEQATCEGCGQKYGGLASHVHSFGEWQTRSAATCTEAEVEFRKCECGAEETQTGDAALEHNMESKFDADNHWTKCSRCDEATAPVAHFGGEATLTEQAICEGCHQPYGDLKEPEKQEYTVNGVIVQDTYITSAKSQGVSQADTNFVNKTELNGNNSNNYRPLLKFSIANVLKDADFESNKDSAKISFTFCVTVGAELLTDSATQYNVTGYLPGEGVSDVDFATVTWNTNKSGGTYEKLYRNTDNPSCNFVLNKAAYADLATVVSISEVDGKTYLTYTFNYSDIEKFVCKDTGDVYGYIVMGFDFNKGIKFASDNSTTDAMKPSVSVTYSK